MALETGRLEELGAGSCVPGPGRALQGRLPRPCSELLPLLPVRLPPGGLQQKYVTRWLK